MKLRSAPFVDKLQPLLIDRANVEGVTVKPEFWVVTRINPQKIPCNYDVPWKFEIKHPTLEQLMAASYLP